MKKKKKKKFIQHIFKVHCSCIAWELVNNAMLLPCILKNIVQTTVKIKRPNHMFNSPTTAAILVDLPVPVDMIFFPLIMSKWNCCKPKTVLPTLPVWRPKFGKTETLQIFPKYNFCCTNKKMVKGKTEYCLLVLKNNQPIVLEGIPPSYSLFFFSRK